MSLSRKSQLQQSGIGQLTLVEHALCPLDSRPNVAENLAHRASYRFSAPDGKRRTSSATVYCPLGLSPNDELYLWGLLSLTLTHGREEGRLSATPHWCLRRLSLIDARKRRGGRQYHQFAESLRRLSVVKYVSDNFYDPVVGEHRRVSFGFLSYSLPLNLESSRSWRISWDAEFFRLVSAQAGHFRFDLALYRGLDAATRRLFLFACKVFARRPRLPTMNLRELAVGLLGFSESLAPRNMKVKALRCIERLQELDVLGEASIERIDTAEYVVTLKRGRYFERQRRRQRAERLNDDPLAEILLGIGFDRSAVARLLRIYPHRDLATWADITQAAQEHHGSGFFHKSPMAFFVDAVSKAAKGERTPPDWWQTLRRSELKPQRGNGNEDAVLKQIQAVLPPDTDPTENAENSSPAGLTALGNVLRKGTAA